VRFIFADRNTSLIHCVRTAPIYISKDEKTEALNESVSDCPFPCQWS